MHAVARPAAQPSHRLLVYVDDMQAAFINLEVDLTILFAQMPSWNGKLLAGFTSGTGNTYGSHTIESWNFWEAVDRSELNSQEGSWFSSFLGGSGR